MNEPKRAESQDDPHLGKQVDQLLSEYVSNPQSPRPEEVQRMVGELLLRQSELEAENCERRDAQKQLEAYRDRYVDLYDLAPLGYVTLDEEGYIQEINLAGARLLGGELAELVGYPFIDYVVTLDQAAFLEHIRKCCGEHQDVTSELGLITKDGRLVVAQLRSVPVKALEHEGTFCKTAITDITARKWAEDELQKEHNLLRTLIDNLPDSIYIKDTQGRFVAANLATARIMGATRPSDLLGKSDYNFYPEEVAAEYFSDEQGLVRSGEPLVNKDEPHVDSQGNLRTVLTTKVPIKDNRGTVVGLVGISHDITERNEAEEALRREKAFADIVIDSIPGLFYVLDSQGRFTRWNHRMEELTGLTAGMLRGMDALLTIVEDDRELVAGKIREVFQKGQAEVEARFLAKDEVRDFWFTGRRMDVGPTAYLVGSGVDVTDRKRVEEAIRASEDNYRAVFDTANDAIFVHDADTGAILDTNQKTSEMFGYTPVELRELSIEDISEGIPPYSQKEALHWLKQAIAGLPQLFTWKCRDKAGRLFWVEVNIKRTILGGVPRLLAIVRDITDRKQTEEKLRASEERFRTVVEATKDAVIAIGQDGLITVFNPAAEHIFGHKCQKILGQPVDVLMPEEYRQRHHQARELYFATGKSRGIIGKTIELPALRANGQVFPIELSLSEGKLGGKPFVLGVIRDITERKQAERSIIQLNERLQIANRDLEAFTSSVCHDLRRPLRTINGFSQILTREYAAKLDETASGYLAHISAAVRQTGALIDDLMKLSMVARAEIQRTSVDLSALVRTIVEGLRKGQPDRKVEFVVQEGITVEGDAHFLRAALENLLDNAWKFTGKHDKARIEFGVVEQDGQQVYFVRDDGAGFNMKFAKKLFEVFQRMHPAEEFDGTGVGLATVERIVRAHGGKVWAEAVVERGAAFFFTVPKLIAKNE